MPPPPPANTPHLTSTPPSQLVNKLLRKSDEEAQPFDFLYNDEYATPV